MEFMRKCSSVYFTSFFYLKLIKSPKNKNAEDFRIMKIKIKIKNQSVNEILITRELW